MITQNIWSYATKILHETDEELVLVTLVKTIGSSYRKPGARMLVLSSGKTIGTISGGCLEQSIAKKAWWFSERTSIKCYSTDIDTNGQSDQSFNLGCNGLLFLLFERISAKKKPVILKSLLNAHLKQIPSVAATAINAPNEKNIGQCITQTHGSVSYSNLAEELVDPSIIKELHNTSIQKKNHSKRLVINKQPIEFFFEYIAPPHRLIIIGTGSDAESLAVQAKRLHFHTTIVTTVAHQPIKKKFQLADAVLHINFKDHDNTHYFRQLVDNANVVIMTHNKLDDIYALESAINSTAAYIGQLGSISRTKLMLEQLLSKQRINSIPKHLHYPIGLDLGGDSPEYIALAILAEITMRINKTTGLPLSRIKG